MSDLEPRSAVLEDDEAAEEAFRKAVEIDPHQIRAQYGLAKASVTVPRQLLQCGTRWALKATTAYASSSVSITARDPWREASPRRA